MLPILRESETDVILPAAYSILPNKNMVPRLELDNLKHMRTKSVCQGLEPTWSDESDSRSQHLQCASISQGVMPSEVSTAD
jgi:hypothetical protein